MLGADESNTRIIDELLKLMESDTWIAVTVIVTVLIYTIAMSLLFVRTISGALKQPEPRALVSALSLLTFIALTGAIITESSALETLSATGIGAIAAAVSHRFTTVSSRRLDEGESIPSEVDSETEAEIPGRPDPEK